ncbi:MAG: hypothetical protein WD737_11135 [Gemmatimonadota bacterium]
MKASTDQQDQWLEETMQFMGERYAGLSDADLNELREIGRRFCQPVIPHGKGNTAISTADEADQEPPESDSEREMAGVA